MKQYKLIKEYPGSPKLGFKQYYCDNTQSSLFINKYPEYWEEVIEKNYEILSFKYKDGNIVSGNTIYLLQHPELYSIHSIKRLSDNEIFTVGDKVDSTISDLGRTTDLTGFKIINDKLTFGLRYLGYYPLGTIILPKQPLFTTEDGVEIFEGDKYSWVNYLLTSGYDCKAYSNHVSHDNLKTFSTKEKAEEYILMNKPCLSLKEVLDIVTFLDRSKKILIELVQSKLNAK